MDRYVIKLDAPIQGTDKKLGHLAGVVTEISGEARVTGLLVSNGLLRKRALVLPIAVFSGTAQGNSELQVALTSEEADQYPEYREIVVEKGTADAGAAGSGAFESDIHPQAGGHSLASSPGRSVEQETIRQGIQPAALLLTGATTLRGPDGRIGRLTHVITTAEPCTIRQFVVEKGSLMPEQIVVPVEQIEKWSDNVLHTGATSAEVDEFLAYQVFRSEIGDAGDRESNA